MKEKKNFGYLGQGYVAPRAENVAIEGEGSLLLTASGITGSTSTEEFITIGGSWFDGDGSGN